MKTRSTCVERPGVALPFTAIAACLMLAFQAHAENPEHPLTWNGITLYGTVDVGLSYQSHGRPPNDFYSNGAYTFPNKASTDSQTGAGDNGLSQSTVGVRGDLAFADGWSGVFKLESAFNPVSGRFTDNQKSLVQNNGLPITGQTAGTDSSVDGQAFSMAAFAGLKSADWGQLTFGRQNTPLKDSVFRYDPLNNSSAFSAVGGNGTAAGGGDTEDARLNASARYQQDFGILHVDTLYARKTSSQGDRGWQFGLGSRVAGLSIDAVAAYKNQAINASSLGVASATSATSVAQLKVVPAKAGYRYAGAGSVSPESALVGTISDNRAWGVFARYDLGMPTLFAAYEHIRYQNPGAPLNAGFGSIGGYTFAIVNNGAYATDKVLRISWLGVKLPVAPGLALTAAAYGYDQDSYTGNACLVPAATAPGTTVLVNRNNPCSSGSQRSYSLVADYHYNAWVDFYAGIMSSHLTGGMASGFAAPSVYNAMAGLRTQF